MSVADEAIEDAAVVDKDGEDVTDEVETSGLDVKRALVARDRAKGIGVFDEAANTNVVAISQAKALASATRGVRVDDDVDGEFGVLIPGTTFAAEARESVTKAARRFAEEAQAVAQRTRLQTPIAAPVEGDEDDEQTSKSPVYITDDANTKFEVRTYNDVTSKYINLDYYEKRIAPRTKYIDGTINHEAVRTATWVFAEEYAQRDGFVSDESSSEEEEEPEREKPPAEPVVVPQEAEQQRGWCCGGSSSVSKPTPPPEVQVAQARSNDKLKVTIDTEQITRDEVKGVSLSLERLELNVQQHWTDMKRFARHLENDFTPEMVNVDPRAREIKEILQTSEQRLQKMLDERSALTAKERQLRKDLDEFEGKAMVAPDPVIASKGDRTVVQSQRPTENNAKEFQPKKHAEEPQRVAKQDTVYDPFEKVGRESPSGLAAMFYFLAPMYLWKYYEWLAVERKVKQSVKSQTTVKAVFFYNPLLVPGARRIRLASSVAEQLAMLLAVQSLLSFQLFIVDQKVNARAPYITLYMFVLLATFNKVATPACVATAKSVKRVKKRGRNTTAGTLWKQEVVETPAAVTRKPLSSTDTVVMLEIESPQVSNLIESNADVSEPNTGVIGADPVVSPQVSAELAPSNGGIRMSLERLSDQDLRHDDTAQSTSSGEESVRTLEEREVKVAKMTGAEKKEAMRMLIVDEFGERQNSATASHIDAFAQSNVDTLSIHESQFGGSRFDGDRVLTSLKPQSEQGDDGNEDIPVIDEEGYERLRREYVAKAREERRKANKSQKPIFDVSEYIPTVFKRGDSKDGFKSQTALNGSTDENALKSTLDMEDIDSVFQAVHGKSSRHKQKYGGGRGHWPNNVRARDVDVKKVARRLNEEDEETWDALAMLDNSREPIT